MATNKTKSNTPPMASTPPKSFPAGKINDEDSRMSSARSGRTGGATNRPQSAPTSAPKKAGGGSAPNRPKEKGRDAKETKDRRGDSPVSATVRSQASQPGPAPNQSSQKEGKAKVSLPSPESVLLGVKLEDSMVKAVEQATQGQRDNPSWFAWRRNRITASVAHRISHSHFANGRSQTPPSSYLASIFNEGPHVMTRAMSWGVQKEAVAVSKYQELKSKELGKQVSVRSCGLFIDPHHCWLAASPDGIVEVQGSEEGLLLEIKCPFKHREHTVAQACQEDRSFCLELVGSAGDGHRRYRLKSGHSYYTQVQCQMAVVGIHIADFVVFTLCETAIVPVSFDPEFWKDTADKLELFYMKAVVPHLRKTRQGIPSLQPEQ